MLIKGKLLAVCEGAVMSNANVQCVCVYYAPGEYVLAYMPGCFTHLLNVSVDLEPANHILWHGEATYTPVSPVIDIVCLWPA